MQGFLPLRLIAVVTGSMEPQIRIGDLAVYDTSETDVEAGDIAAHRMPMWTRLL